MPSFCHTHKRTTDLLTKTIRNDQTANPHFPAISSKCTCQWPFPSADTPFALQIGSQIRIRGKSKPISRSGTCQNIDTAAKRKTGEDEETRPQNSTLPLTNLFTESSYGHIGLENKFLAPLFRFCIKLMENDRVLLSQNQNSRPEI